MALKQVIAVRCDLKMGKGKLAAQVAHAALSAADKSRYRADWIAAGQKKTVVKVRDEAEMMSVFSEGKRAGIAAVLIEDAGHTQLEPGTKTCVGLGPAEESELDRITGGLKLM